MKFHNIDLPKEKIEAFCHKWKVLEFALFGSVLREDFRPDSDIDVLVTFTNDCGWSLWDMFDMRDELHQIFGREIDLIEKDALRNPFRKKEILNHHEIIYAA
ncbi:MAG: nucleotidyltransferase family protein [Sedimentisphaerales bacterium]|nr:nucleotidyltransferase family protein [Sedimentisphaerales bacterium]